MKRRIAISLIIFILILILLPFALTLLDLEGIGIFIITSIILLVYVGIFIFGGLPELIVYGIYGILTSLSLYFFSSDYQLPIIIIATLLVILNPLASFEQVLRKSMKDENTQPIRISITGKRWPFFAYRKEMKNFYHLPQSRKYFISQRYKQLRQIVTLLLLGFGVYYFIHEINHIANTLENFNWANFLTFYVIVIIFLLAYFLHIKGFTSTFRTFAISLFPPIIYMILMTNFDQLLKLFVLIGFAIFALVISGIELYRFIQRVSYDELYYYDVDLQREVYANALFEPIVYNETYTLCSIYTIKTDKKTFDTHYHDILVYANLFHFIIVAYTVGDQDVEIHAHFYYKDHKRVEKFGSFLENRFQKNIPIQTFSDYNKTAYEETFFHKDAYIIARAQHLASLLKQLHIKSKIIVSLVIYFENEANYKQFESIYPLQKLNEITVDGVISAKLDCLCINNHYVIETKVRDILLNLMIYQGKFVRLNVYY